jgi:hypothetical protein
MEKTILELSQRLKKLENELQAIRRESAGKFYLPPRALHPLGPAEWGAIASEDAERNAEYYSQLMAQALTDMGITGEPLDREALFKLYDEAGFNSDSTEFAQGIVAMRDEE